MRARGRASYGAGVPDVTAAKLTVELVPRTCWLSNVRTFVSRLEWDQMRRLVYARARYQCEVCGGRGDAHPVECHEVWAYDETSRVQRLVRLVALCPACHQVKHIGHAQILDRGDEAFDHLMWVNGWTPEHAVAYLERVWARWERCSRLRWSLDMTALREYGIPPRDNHGGSYLYAPGGMAPRMRGPEFQGIEPGPPVDGMQRLKRREEIARRLAEREPTT